jgi:hypothetical protein
MTSAVDVTFPADNVKTDKALMRAQMLILYNEITALQKRTSVPGAKAFYGFLDEAEIVNLISGLGVRRKSNLPEDLAFGRVTLT